MRSHGFTLIELLIVIVLAGAILGIILTMTSSSLRLYTTDQQRLQSNRTLRGVMDSLSADIQQTGENLDAQAPAVKLTTDASGQSVLTLRRALTAQTLPLCSPYPAQPAPYVTGTNPYAATFSGGASNLSPNCGATPVPTATWNAVISALPAQDRYGLLVDVTSRAELPFRPAASALTITGTAETLTLTPLGTGTFDPRRTAAAQPDRDMRLYLIEERVYRVTGGNLTIADNGNAAQIAAPGITAFTVTAYDATGTALSLPLPTSSWRTVASIGITLTTTTTRSGHTLSRTTTEQFTIRNASSTDGS